MGTVFVVVAGQHGTNARDFYRMFPAESVLPDPQILTVDRVERVSPPSLDRLLQTMARRREREAVIVSHGSPTQLALPVLQGVNIGLDLNLINLLLGAAADGDVARRLRTQARRVRTLRGRIRQVQRLGLTRLEFRACRVGQRPATLAALRRLFGARACCAPSAFDGYGRIRGTRPTRDGAALARWQAAHPGYQSFGSAPDRFFWVNDGSVDPPVISAVFAESWDAVRGWAVAKFPSGANHRFRQGTFYYHMQTSMLPTSSQVHGSRTFNSHFVFPNDAGYRQNLVQARVQPPAAPASQPRQGRGPVGQGTRYAESTARRGPTAGAQPSGTRLPGPQGRIV